MDFLAWFWIWITYFLVWTGLFIMNFLVFSKTSWLNIDRHIIQEQNKALSKIIKGQLLWQAIMIGSLIYFLWYSIDKIYLSWVFHINILMQNIVSLIAFWIIWIIVFQLTLFVISKILPLKKEIIIDQNESLASIVEWLLISISIILSLSLYAY